MFIRPFFHGPEKHSKSVCGAAASKRASIQSDRISLGNLTLVVLKIEQQAKPERQESARRRRP